MMEMDSRRTSAFCMLTMLLTALAMTAPSLMLPRLAERLGVGVAASGAVFTANFLGYSIFALAGGALADRIGKKNALLLALAGIAATGALIPLAGSFPLLAVVIFLYGGFAGVAQLVANSAQADLHQDNPAFYMNLNGAFFGTGAILMPLASSALSGLRQECLVLFLAVAALFLLLCVSIAAFPWRKDGAAKMGLTAGDVSMLARNGRLWLVGACAFLYCGTEVSTWGWMSTFLKQSLGYTAAESSAAVAVFWAAMTLGRVLIGRLSSRFSMRALFSALCVSSAAAVLLCGLTSSPQAYWAVIAFAGLSFSGIYPLLLTFGAEKVQPASSRTAAYAILMALANSGVAAIPALTGVVSQSLGLQAAMAGPAILFAVILSAVLLISARDSRAASPAAQAGESLSPK